MVQVRERQSRCDLLEGRIPALPSCSHGTRLDRGARSVSFDVTQPISVGTQIECALDEWSSGTQVDVKFFASKYKGNFEANCSMLKKFEADTHTHNIIPMIQAKIYKDGW